MWVLAAHRWVETDGQTGGWNFEPGKGVVNIKDYTAAMQGVWPNQAAFFWDLEHYTCW